MESRGDLYCIQELVGVLRFNNVGILVIQVDGKREDFGVESRFNGVRKQMSKLFESYFCEKGNLDGFLYLELFRKVWFQGK